MSDNHYADALRKLAEFATEYPDLRFDQTQVVNCDGENPIEKLVAIRTFIGDGTDVSITSLLGHVKVSGMVGPIRVVGFASAERVCTKEVLGATNEEPIADWRLPSALTVR